MIDSPNHRPEITDRQWAPDFSDSTEPLAGGQTRRTLFSDA